MYTCPLCGARSFGFWQIALTPQLGELSCDACKGRVQVHQPDRFLAMVPALLALLAMGRSRSNVVMDGAILVMLVVWQCLYLHRGLSLTCAPPGTGRS